MKTRLEQFSSKPENYYSFRVTSFLLPGWRSCWDRNPRVRSSASRWTSGAPCNSLSFEIYSPPAPDTAVGVSDIPATWRFLICGLYGLEPSGNRIKVAAESMKHYYSFIPQWREGIYLEIHLSRVFLFYCYSLSHLLSNFYYGRRYSWSLYRRRTRSWPVLKNRDCTD